MRYAAPLALLLAVTLQAGEEQAKSKLALLVEKFRDADPVRRDAASRAARDEVARLLEPLLRAAKDPDPEVRRRALAAIRMELPPEIPVEVPNWHPMKAAGAPDAVANQDHPNAWASASGNMGEQWLQLGYRAALRIDRVRIFEVNRAGAIAAVEAIDEKGKHHVLWKGRDPTKVPGVFELKFPLTPYKVRGIRLVLDTNRVSGWNEIDAVEIVGPKGRAWAVSATASSSYATR
jgi:hypothetical protein